MKKFNNKQIAVVVRKEKDENTNFLDIWGNSIIRIIPNINEINIKFKLIKIKLE